MNPSLIYCYISQTKMACDVCRNLNCPGVESDVAQSFLIVSLPRCYESCLVSFATKSRVASKKPSSLYLLQLSLFRSQQPHVFLRSELYCACLFLFYRP